MKTTTFLLGFLITTVALFGQNNNPKYDALIRKADSLYQVADYRKSAHAFSDAFNVPGANITMNQRYNAACSYALANNADSAFVNLNHIATFMNYSRYSHIMSDPDLKSLYTDSRWKPLLELVKLNKDKAYAIAQRLPIGGRATAQRIPCLWMASK